MPDAPVTPPAPKPEAKAETSKRGYFNQGQLEDLESAEKVLASAGTYAAEMVEQDIDADYIDGLTALAVEARRRSAETAGEVAEAELATAEARESATKLVQGLQRIQSAAKQKNKMLAEDDDPETNFPLDGYLIGLRLDASHTLLLQNAAALIAKAKADSLPGFKTAAKIADVEKLLADYRKATEGKARAGQEKELSRISRDELVSKINTRCSAIQHAADALWPWHQESSRPIRKAFDLPLGRPLKA